MCSSGRHAGTSFDPWRGHVLVLVVTICIGWMATGYIFRPVAAQSCSKSLRASTSIQNVNLPARVSRSSKIRVFAASNREILIAWSEDSADLSTIVSIHITRLSQSGEKIGGDWIISGKHVRGITETPAGYALLVAGESDNLRLIQLARDGKTVWEKTILAACPDISRQLGCMKSDPYWSRDDLLWQPTEQRLAVYFGAYKNLGSIGVHQSDVLQFYGADGRLLSGGWGYAEGCAHSFYQQLSDNRENLAVGCFSDVRPQEGIGVSFFSGVSPRQITLTRTSGSTGPDGIFIGSKEMLGGILPTSRGFLAVYSSADGRASGDIGIAQISVSSGVAPKIEERMWLTNTATEDEQLPRIAPFDGGFLVGWHTRASQAPTADAKSYLARIDAAGQLQGAPEEVSARLSGVYWNWLIPQEFFSYSNGDVGWVTVSSSTFASLDVVRVGGCGSPIVSFDHIKDKQILSGNVKVSATGIDDVAVASLELLLDGARIERSLSSTYVFDLATDAYAPGEHTLEVRAYDAAGNYGVARVVVTFMSSVEINQLDVTRDGVVAPIDALVLINRLNRDANPRIRTPQEASFDVNRDGIISPSDVLRIINYLNAAFRSESGGEGEAPRLESLRGEFSMRLYGTEGSDVVTVSVGLPTVVTINRQKYELPGYIKHVQIEGGGGRDSIVLNGSRASERIEGVPGAINYTSMQGGGLTNLFAGGFETISIDSGGGSDEAQLQSAQAAESLSGYPGKLRMVGGGYDTTVSGFRTMYVTSAGDNDEALLYDSAGSDQFVTINGTSTMFADQFQTTVSGFKSVVANASGKDGDDRAYLHGTQGRDEINLGPRGARLTSSGSSLTVLASGFKYVSLFSRNGGFDRLTCERAFPFEVTRVGTWLTDPRCRFK